VGFTTGSRAEVGTREERKPVTRNDDDNNNNNNNNNKQYQDNTHRFPTKTAILGTSHIRRKVLQAET
jgi:hypothetical protein